MSFSVFEIIIVKMIILIVNNNNNNDNIQVDCSDNTAVFAHCFPSPMLPLLLDGLPFCDFHPLHSSDSNRFIFLGFYTATFLCRLFNKVIPFRQKEILERPGRNFLSLTNFRTLCSSGSSEATFNLLYISLLILGLTLL